MPVTTDPPAGASHQVVAPSAALEGSRGSTATRAALVYWIVAPPPLVTVASTKVKEPL